MVKRYRPREDSGGWTTGMEEAADGSYVRIIDYAAELALWKSNHAFASKLADDLTQDGIKDRARIRELEAALRDMVEAAEVGKVFTSGSRINPVLLKARDALSAPETSVQSAPRDWYCPNCDCDLCGAVQGRLERTAAETKGEQG